MPEHNYWRARIYDEDGTLLSEETAPVPEIKAAPGKPGMLTCRGDETPPPEEPGETLGIAITEDPIGLAES